MKILYGARMARYDLLKATCFLATKVTKWTVICDKRMHRLVCYINCTLDLRMVGWVGDDLSELDLVSAVDADFAGDSDTERSTSGLFLVVEGDFTYFPWDGGPHGQSATSMATAESEIIDELRSSYLWPASHDFSLIFQ